MPLYLDTDVVVWLYQDGAARLSERGAQAIETAGTILVSPIVELELAHLREIGRVTPAPASILDTLARDLELATCRLPFSSVVGEAAKQTWTRDPFDRLIVAQAAHGGAPLLTADRNLLRHYPAAFW